MKAFALTAFDTAPQLTEIDTPVPAAGEVRVKIHAASVNGFDLAVGNGYLNGMMEHRFPVVLGKDFAGTVDEVGPGVDGFAVGDRVFGVVTKDFLGDGSFAEFVTVPASVGIAKLPTEVTFEEGAALGLAGTAAVQSFDAAEIGEGTTVLVAGATGGVGNQVVQLAAREGATVIATAASTDEIAQVTGLGASATVDYTGDVTASVRESYPDGVDVVLHFAGDPAALATVVRPGGRFVSTLVQSPDQVPVEGVQVVPVFAVPSTTTLDRLARNQAEKRTTVTLQRTYPLDDASEAFADFAGGTLGKLLVVVR
jgi:NADPH:quinone reductase-like Zn-dependent oxidoreductase